MCGFAPSLNYCFAYLSRASPSDGTEAAFDPSPRPLLDLLPLAATHPVFFTIDCGHILSLMDMNRLRAIYPTLTDEELKEADENLRRYFACALQIASEAHPGAVDSSERLITMKERSNSTLKQHSV
jgi:hypothetical protein